MDNEINKRILPYIGKKVLCKDNENSYSRTRYIELEILQVSPSLDYTKIKYPSSCEIWIKTEDLFSKEWYRSYEILEIV